MPKKVPPPGTGLPLCAGLADFAILFRQKPRTVDTWVQRAKEIRANPHATPEQLAAALPEPDLVVSNRCPLWAVDRLAVWADLTGRPIYVDDLAQHRASGAAPPRRQ